MPYSTPATQTTGDVIGATQWNRFVDDTKWLAEIGSSGAPCCMASLAAVQTLTNNTFTAVQYDNNVFDNAGCHSTSTNKSRFTAPVDGLYILGTYLVYAANGTGVRISNASFNGTGTVIGGQSVGAAMGIFDFYSSFVSWSKLSAGQYLETGAYQNTGGNLNLQVGSYSFFAWMRTYT